jgi:hypothetical protein
MSSTEPAIDQSRFRVVDWSEFYPDAEEAIPWDAPEPLASLTPTMQGAG